MVEILYWEGCPSWPETLAEVRAALSELGLVPDLVTPRELDTDEAARTAAFVGSPTVRVGGRDLFPPGDDPVGLTCRIYRRRDGRVSPTPDPDDLRDALREALAVHR
jgi:hypothetical protein